MAGKLKKGKGFDLEDMREQMQQISKMGGMDGLMDKLPGMGQMGSQVSQQMDDQQVRRQIAMINAMTPGERRKPDVINGSRKRRIAFGSGLPVQEVNRLLKQHKQMQKMMKQFRKGGMKKMMRQLGGGGGMPPGGMPPGGGLPPGLGGR